LIAEMIRSENR